MKNKTYFLITAIIFLIVGIVHLIKILTGFEIQIIGKPYPLLFSWIEMIIAFSLSFIGFKLGKKENIYKKIWKLAKPYYKKGRPMDVDHIKWMIPVAEEMCEKEGIDKTIFMPLIILHDAGYSEVENPKDNPFQLDMRKTHMKAGEELSKKILKSINYDTDKIEKISYYISVHDNWAFGDDGIFLKDPILGAFNDLDFMWMATSKGFSTLIKIRNTNPKEMLNYIITDDKLTKRPFSNKTTKELFEKYINERKKEILGSN